MFYEFNQNNSGGFFDCYHEDGVSVLTIFEADSAEEANNLARAHGIYFDGVENDQDCSCCGDRWYPVDDSDGTSVPACYGQPLAEAMNVWTWLPEDEPNAYVHLSNGTIVPLHVRDERYVYLGGGTIKGVLG